MPKLTKWQKKVVRARAKDDSSKVSRQILLVIIILPVLFAVGLVIILVLGESYLPFSIAVAVPILMFFTMFRTTRKHGLIINALFMHHRHQWLEFLNELNHNDREELEEKLGQLNLSPDDSLLQIAEDFLTSYRRTKELKTNLDEIKRSDQSFYENAFRLSLEWKRMETAYLLYHRSEDINSKILQDKVLGYTERIAQETSHFQKLIGRFKDSLNHLAAYELDAAVSSPTKAQTSPASYQHLDGLIGELQEWSGSLTKAAEEMTQENF